MDPKRREASVSVIKKLCDGLNITLGELFSAPVFDSPEQEICQDFPVEKGRIGVRDK